MLCTIPAAWAETVSTSYVDEGGTTHNVTATVLTQSSAASLPGSSTSSWYVVNSDITLSGVGITRMGDINLILADGKTLTIQGGGISSSTSSVCIYGQTNGTGKLSINCSNNSYSAAIHAYNNVSITGCIVEAKSTNGYGISCGNVVNSTITITGGQVTASGSSNGKGLQAEGNNSTITLGWSKHADYIKFNGCSGKMYIKSGQTLYHTSQAFTGYVSNPQPGEVILRPFSSNDMEVNNTGEYTIKTSTGWDVFCNMLTESPKGIFTGKTVKLAADIEVTRKAGSSNQDFTGTFDGQGNTLTFNYGSSGAYTSDQYAAPFSYITNTTLPGDTANSPATIRNLHVNGNIYTSAKYAAGIVGVHWGTLNLKNCRSSIVIHSNVGGDGTHGGIEAVNNGTLSIEGCVFDGKILTTGTTATTHCGGFVGWNVETISISNSLYNPAAITGDETEIGSDSTFVRNGLPGTNCYYTRTLGTAQGKAIRTVTAGEYTTVDAIALTGDTTIYSVSGITSYSGGGLEYGGNIYYGNGDVLILMLGTVPSPCYEENGYQPSAGTLSGKNNPYTLTMPDEDVTISATYVDYPGLHSASLSIVGCSESKVYDGTPLTSNRIVVTEGSYDPQTVDAGQPVTLFDDYILSVNLSSGSITNAGTLDDGVVIESYTILKDGTDYSCHFNVTTANGSLTVTPQPVLITVNDVYKEYGDADPEITGSVTGLINEGDLGTIEYYYLDDALEQIGNYPDTLSAHYTPNSNYAVTIDKGDLRIDYRHLITKISKWLTDTTSIDDCFSKINTSVLPDADSVKTLIDKNVTDITANEYSVEITDVAIDSSSCDWKWERTYTITSSNPVYCSKDSMVLTVSGGDRTAPVHSNNDLWKYGTLYQDACLASFNMDMFLPQDQDLFDDCSPMTINHTDTSWGNDLDGWTICRTYVVSDACGHTIYDTVKVSGRDQTPPVANNPKVKKDILWADNVQCLCDSIRVINDFDELVSLFGLSDECTGDSISLVSKTRTFKIGNQSNHHPDTVVVAYTVADTYGNAKTFYHAQLIQDTTGPSFSIAPFKDTTLCVDPDGDYEATVNRVAALVSLTDIHDNCTRLQGNITVSDPTINFDPSENDNDGYTTDDNGIRTYYKVWSVTDSCGNTTRDMLGIHLYPLATIRIDSLDNQTITYGEDIKEVEVHNQYSDLSVPDLGSADGITFSSDNRLMGQPSAAGTYVYHPTATSTHECNSVETSGTVKVNPRPITITAASARKKYDGKPLTSNNYTCTLTPPFTDINNRILVNNDSIASVTITGSQTNVGISENIPGDAVITIATETTADKNPSYDISYANGTLEVITNDTLIRVIPGSGSKLYDGTPFTMTAHDDFTVIGVPDGLTWTATADGIVTNVIPGEGEKAENAVTSFRIFDADGIDVTCYFTNINTTATGTLTIRNVIMLDEDSTSNALRIQENNNRTDNVALTRSISADKWSTIVLPFAMTAAQLKTTFGDDVMVAALTGGDAFSLNFTSLDLTDEATVTTAGQPYAIKVADNFTSAILDSVTIKDTTPVQTVSDWQFVGAYTAGNIPAGSYFFSANQLWQAEDATNTIKPFRAYFTYNGVSLAPQLNFIIDAEETTTGLEIGKKESKVVKFFKNGKLFILREGVVYDVTGRKVK